MAIAVFPAPVVTAKTAYRLSLLSGTSWTVPAGVTYVNVTLVGGGGGSPSSGGSGFAGNSGNAGGTTTFTGATSANGGAGCPTYLAQNTDNGGGFRGPAIAGHANSGEGARGFQTTDTGGSPRQYSGNGIPIAQQGQVSISMVLTTPGASITYAIAAGGTPGATGAGGAGASGGSGRIDIEYWA